LIKHGLRPKPAAPQHGYAQTQDQEQEGIIVKNLALSLALAFSFAGTAQAALVEVPASAGIAAGSPAAFPALTAGPTASDLKVVQAVQVVTPPVNMSELPEPEVFAMMLLGLCLIGYRASRHSDEKFE